MERERPPYRAAVTKPARPSIWPTLIVLAVLLSVIGSGFVLLGKTRAKWERNRVEKASKIAEFGHQWKTQQFPTPSSTKAAPCGHEATMELLRERRRRAAELRQDEITRLLKEGKLRFVNGQLFRKLPNGWENIPGERCS